MSETTLRFSSWWASLEQILASVYPRASLLSRMYSLDYMQVHKYLSQYKNTAVFPKLVVRAPKCKALEPLQPQESHKIDNVGTNNSYRPKQYCNMLLNEKNESVALLATFFSAIFCNKNFIAALKKKTDFGQPARAPL